MEQLLEGQKLVNHIVPASRSAGATNGTGIDTNGVDAATFLVAVGAIGDTGADTTIDCKVQESDALGSGYVDITDAAITQLANTDDNALASIGVRLGGRANRKRYIRAVLTIAGSDAALVGVAVLLKAQQMPVTNTPASVLV